MTMYFRQVRDAIASTLVTAAAERYKVVDYQRQTVSAEDIKTLKTVEVYYSGGDLSKGPVNGPKTHDMTFTVILDVATQAVTDIATLEDTLSTAGQISAALLATKVSSSQANLLLDEFIDLIWQILMDARNQDFSQADPSLKYKISNREVNSVRKGRTNSEGDLAILTAELTLTLTAKEEIVGETLTTGLLGVDTVITQDGDPNANTGINVPTTP